MPIVRIVPCGCNMLQQLSFQHSASVGPGGSLETWVTMDWFIIYPNFDGKAQQGLKWRESSGQMHVKYCNMLALEHHLKFSKWLIVNAMLAILAPASAFLCRRYKDFYRIMFTYKASNFIKPHVRSPPSTTRLADRWRQSARGSTDL